MNPKKLFIPLFLIIITAVSASAQRRGVGYSGGSHLPRGGGFSGGGGGSYRGVGYSGPSRLGGGYAGAQHYGGGRYYGGSRGYGYGGYRGYSGYRGYGYGGYRYGGYGRYGFGGWGWGGGWGLGLGLGYYGAGLSLGFGYPYYPFYGFGYPYPSPPVVYAQPPVAQQPDGNYDYYDDQQPEDRYKEDNGDYTPRRQRRRVETQPEDMTGDDRPVNPDSLTYKPGTNRTRSSSAPYIKDKVWIKPHWNHTGDGWVWIDGYWK